MGPRSLVASAALVAGAAAQFASFTNSDHSLTVNVPSDTASSGSGPIYFQITAPIGTRWAAFGQGTGMRGAQMFVIYTSADGRNITLSPRMGTGFVQPKHDSSIQATLLEGSGIANGLMVANVRCDSCLTWGSGSMDPKSSASDWIYAYQSGDVIDSDDPAATISKHDSRGEFTLDLTQGTGGSSTNPFVTTQDQPSSSAAGSSSTSSGTPSSTGTNTQSQPTTATNGVSVPVASNNPNPANSGSSSADSSNRTIYNNPFSHGVLMSVLFVGLFPLVSLTLYLPTDKKVRFFHAPLQVVNLILLIVGMALGIVYGRQIELLSGYHQIIGYIVVATLVLIQPALGIYQHLHFHKTGQRSAIGIGHQWFGRAIIALGIINGGLGWALTETTSAYVPYGVVAGIMFVLYAAVAVLGSWRQKKRQEAPRSPTDKEGLRLPSRES